MESNNAVTLPFEDLAIENYFFFYRCVDLLVNILMTKSNIVRERAFFTLPRTLLPLVIKIFKKEKVTLTKST